MHRGENYSASKKQIKTCIFTQIRLEGDYLLSNMITFCFLYRKKTKAPNIQNIHAGGIAALADGVESKIEHVGRITPYIDHYGGRALAPPTLATSTSRMDQKAAASANGSSSTFK